MSGRELERVEVLGRVASKGLKLKDAAAMLQVSYRQAKRLWRRYQQAGAKGLQHGNAGKASNQWYKNVLKNPQIRIDARDTEARVTAKPITESAAVKSVIEKFREKYGAKDVKKYYSKFGCG